MSALLCLIAGVVLMLITRGLGSTSSEIGAAGGAVGGTLASTVGAWAPLLGVTGTVGLAIAGGVALVTGLLSAFGVGNGCGQTCVTASNDANQIEAALRANLAAYQNGQIDQATAVANYNSNWQALVNACSNASLGTAGQNCIGDRQQGACHFKDANDQCWNWYIGYYMPLLQPPTNAPAVSSSLGLTTPQLLGLALLGVVALEVL